MDMILLLDSRQEEIRNDFFRSLGLTVPMPQIILERYYTSICDNIEQFRNQYDSFEPKIKAVVLKMLTESQMEMFNCELVGSMSCSEDIFDTSDISDLF
jgi:hypothetical protein